MNTLLMITAVVVAAAAQSSPIPLIECNDVANETLLACGNHCELQCGDGEFKACTADCRPAACGCKSGFYRNTTGSCVTKDDCGPEPTITCANVRCMSGCEMVFENGVMGPRCTQLNTTPITSLPLQCNGAANETMMACGNQCEPKCGDQLPKICTAQCASPACGCKDGFSRNTDGLCVAMTDCAETVCSAQCEDGFHCALVDLTCEDGACETSEICIEDSEYAQLAGSQMNPDESANIQGSVSDTADISAEGSAEIAEGSAEGLETSGIEADDSKYSFDGSVVDNTVGDGAADTDSDADADSDADSNVDSDEDDVASDEPESEETQESAEKESIPQIPGLVESPTFIPPPLSTVLDLIEVGTTNSEEASLPQEGFDRETDLNEILEAAQEPDFFARKRRHVEEGPSCLTAKCSAGHVCIMKQVQCIRAPCNPQPTCVPVSEGSNTGGRAYRFAGN